MMMIFWLLIIAGVIWYFRSGRGKDVKNPFQRHSPEDTIRERYARGEIDADEMRRMLNELRR